MHRRCAAWVSLYVVADVMERRPKEASGRQAMRLWQRAAARAGAGTEEAARRLELARRIPRAAGLALARARRDRSGYEPGPLPDLERACAHISATASRTVSG